MFTGIVAGTGKICSFQNMGSEARFVIEPAFNMANIANGESIAINGACLSVEKHANGNFTVYASEETLSKTNLAMLQRGSIVNLERALALGERLGGHIVTGHIDCIALLENITPRGLSLRLRFSFPAEFGSLVVAKGSVALNGISLTINACGGTFLEVNVIPDTQMRTNLGDWRVGDGINMETDLLGKYVRHMLKPWQQEDSLNMDFLAMHGFV